MNESENKKCPFCGSPVQENASFCLHCMKPLEEKKVIEKKKSKKPIIVLTALGVGLVVVTFSLVYLICALTDNANGAEPIGEIEVTDTSDESVETQAAEKTEETQKDDKNKTSDSEKNPSDTDKSDKKAETGDANSSEKSGQNVSGTTTGGSNNSGTVVETNKTSGNNSSQTNSNQNGGNTAGGSSNNTSSNTSSSTSSNKSSSNSSSSNSSSSNSSSSNSSSSNSSSSNSSSHTHSYKSYTVKNPTCAVAGETEYICSCGDKYSKAILATGEHIWYALTTTVHHDAVGHYEDVKKSKPVTKYKCPLCYKNYDSLDEYYNHFDSVHTPYYEGDPVFVFRKEYTTVTEYEPYTVQEWVVDQKAYDETVITGYKCSVCGNEK